MSWFPSIAEVLRRESIYLWYYCDVQFRQIAEYWVWGMMIGSAVSVFGKARLRRFCEVLGRSSRGPLGLALASFLGILSPLCLYGTVPVAASFSRKGLSDSWLAAFMMGSILLNPQLLIYSAALGRRVLLIRFFCCLLCGTAAGAIVERFFGCRGFFDFRSFEEGPSRDRDPNLLLRYLKNLGRNFRATGPWFFLGILLSAVFQRYVPSDLLGRAFGSQEGFGVLLAATVGVPLYVCGGGTIPLLMDWLSRGMSLGAAAAFMLSGPATKITNLGALKILLGRRHFAFYLIFVAASALLTGAAVNGLF